MTLAPPGRAIDRDPSTDADAVLDRFRDYRASGDRALRNELVETHRSLAVRLARRYQRTGESFDDLIQVAMLGVLKAVERFDPEREIEFARFASATVTGELKRYFRDSTWTVRVPRTARDLSIELRTTIEQLGHRLQRSPTVAEIAREAGVSMDLVLFALEANAAYRPSSLDDPGRDGGGRGLDAFLGRVDEGFARSDDRDQVLGLLSQLPERERRIIELRFFEGQTQTEIAGQIGISQMHVSRLIARALGRLRVLAKDPVASVS